MIAVPASSLQKNSKNYVKKLAMIHIALTHFINWKVF